jgi:glycosyltransferase involved in cell wall biosynthesis
MPQAAIISFRLGGDDGVSVEARKWETALQALGFETRRVAGAIEDSGRSNDIVVPELAIDAQDVPNHEHIARTLDGADLVVVDNICSLPLNLAAAEATERAVEQHRGRVCYRHHDLPWQRRHLRHLERRFPPRTPDALHATINLRSRRELEARGYADAVTIHNYFDLEPPPGDRGTTRKRFDFADDAFVLFQPARAIERKNVPGGLRFAQRLQQLAPELKLHYWLSGPAEDGYGPTLERLREAAPLPFTVGRADSASDAYAAADLVVFPSTWEGFGNPVVESIAHRRGCATFPYPVLAELHATGIRTFSTERPENVVQFLADTDAVREQYYEVNLHRARISFDIADLPAAIDEAFSNHGWLSW